VQKLFNQYLVEIEASENILRCYIETALCNAINKECLASWRLGLWKSVSMAEYKANFKFDPPKISNHEEYILYIHQEQDKWKVYKDHVFLSHKLILVYKLVNSFLPANDKNMFGVALPPTSEEWSSLEQRQRNSHYTGY
jgi:hypothetical protein